jgi:hypothetical protein
MSRAGRFFFLSPLKKREREGAEFAAYRTNERKA